MATIVEQLRKEIASREAELANLKSALLTLSGGSPLRKAANASKAAKTGGGRPGWTPERRAKMEAALAARKAAGRKK